MDCYRTAINSPNTPFFKREIRKSTTILRNEHSAEIVSALRAEIVTLRQQLSESEEKSARADADILRLSVKERELENRISMSQEEIAMFTFINSIQDQAILELEQTLSSCQLEQNELKSSRNRRHKAEISRLNEEKVEYETRADKMIQDLNDQMTLLQNFAMKRIAELEEALLEESRKKSDEGTNSSVKGRAVVESEEEGDVDEEEEGDGNETE
jgi:hypothetical protein